MTIIKTNLHDFIILFVACFKIGARIYRRYQITVEYINETAFDDSRNSLADEDAADVCVPDTAIYCDATPRSLDHRHQRHG